LVGNSPVLHAPCEMGAGCSPSSSYSLPLMDVYLYPVSHPPDMQHHVIRDALSRYHTHAMKWYTSSSSVAVRCVSSMNGDDRANELCVSRIKSELDSVSPRSCSLVSHQSTHPAHTHHPYAPLAGTRPQTP
jgi:hypothetical protein